MATIRVRDWTKERIEEIRDAESHSSHDSVIKGLLKDRELAKFAGEPIEEPTETGASETPYGGEKAYDDLTVLAEMDRADNGIVFLWCPNCGTEIAHATFDDRITMSVFEVECQRCLTRLDQRAIVSIEVGYPIEERVVEGTVDDDLQACVVDYWDRSLEALAAGTLDEGDVDDDQLVWRYNDYLAEFGWTWPPDVPAIGVWPGGIYRDDATGDRIEVLEAVTDNRGALDDYRVERTPAGSDQSETDVLEAEEIVTLVLGRNLVVEEQPAAEGVGEDAERT